MTVYQSRAAWNAAPRRHAPGALDPNEAEGTALHWPAMKSPLIAYSAVAAALRGWQRYHMTPEPDGHGWSDIAYQAAVDQAGRAWILRGLGNRSAANGDEDVNARYGAILLVIAPNEAPSPAMRTTVRDVITDFRRLYPKATKIVPHSKIRPEPTDCPGDRVRAGIIRGDFTPLALPTEIDDMDVNTPLGDDPFADSPMTLGKIAARVNSLYGNNIDSDGTASDHTLLLRICAALNIDTSVPAK